MTAGITTSTPTRGERNHNPGNIERGAVAWQNEVRPPESLPGVQPEPRFAQFRSPEDGIRALAKLVRNYHQWYNLNTVRSVINRWAPPKENDTSAYVKHVAEMMGVDADEPLNLHEQETLQKITKAIITHENGRCIYHDNVIHVAVRRAFS